MKKIVLGLVAMLCFSALHGADLTLEAVLNGMYYGESMPAVYNVPNKEQYAVLNDDGTAIVAHSYATGKQVEVLWDLAKMKEARIESIDDFMLSPDGSKILLQTNTQRLFRRSYTATYYIYTLGNNSIEPIAEGGAVECPVWSPDGNLIAYVLDGNVHLVKLLYNNADSQVTKDGDGVSIFNGKPDWLYEEEFSISRALMFSADSKMLCWVRYDDTQVGTISYPIFLNGNSIYPSIASLRYPKAGTANPNVSVQSFDIQSRVVRTLKVPVSEGGYIPRLVAMPSVDDVAVLTLNRNQNQLDIYRANLRSTECKLLLRDEAKYYIAEEFFPAIRFYADGSFTYISERNGAPQAFLFSSTGTPRFNTNNTASDVTDIYGYNAATGEIYYRATLQDNTQRTAVLATNIKTNKTVDLTPQAGTNEAVLFSDTYNYFIAEHNSLAEPTTATLYNSKGKAIASLLDNAALKDRVAQIASKPSIELIKATAAGREYNGWIMKPADFDASRKYPLIVFQYSGPKTQEAIDTYNIGIAGTLYGYEAYLATQGFVVACIDPRGTGGKGTEWSGATYMKLGVLEADDHNAVAREYFARLPYIDGARIGIWGWSYGGYTSLMSIMHGEHAFRAAVAVAPLTDWRLYDTAYAERFMRTPQENADGYNAASTITRTANLQDDRLLLIHGLADDNVHYQNTALLSEQLVQDNKQFRMQVYTDDNHNIAGGNTRRHLFTLITRFFVEKLQ